MLSISTTFWTYKSIEVWQVFQSVIETILNRKYWRFRHIEYSTKTNLRSQNHYRRMYNIQKKTCRTSEVMLLMAIVLSILSSVSVSGKKIELGNKVSRSKFVRCFKVFMRNYKLPKRKIWIHPEFCILIYNCSLHNI